MYPELIKLGPFTIHTYGFLIAVGFLSALSVARRLAILSKLNPDRVLDMAFWVLLVGFVGARALYIVTRFQYFAQEPLAMFKVWEGGLVFLGGPLAALPFLIWYTRKYKFPIWKVLDIGAPCLALAHMFGRFGCLASGCCYGKPTGSTWYGIRLYSEFVDRQYHGILLHPTQLYEATALGLLFIGLLVIFKRKVFDGQVALSYFLVYPAIRSIIEIFRGDLIRGFVVDETISTSQFLSIFIFVGAAIALWYRLKQVHQQKV